MNRRTFLVSLSAPLAMRAGGEAIRPIGRTRLFNGKNLDGWYTWLKDHKYDDPHKVFTVVDRQLKITGEDWGGIASKNAYRDYRLVAEWRWGGPAHGKRAKAARDSGILVHGNGEDGAYSGTWLESIESQIIEGGSGDFIVVGAGKFNPSLTAEVRTDAKGETFWQKGGEVRTRNRGRFNWYGRDPEWKDTLGFRGRVDVEKPAGKWNRQEVICKGDTITNVINGKVVNVGSQAKPSSGKIQIQSEGAEIWFRRIDLYPA
ncbi:MAG: DUF1080 domain-containing protein [Bryobacteraceae bacterium]